MEDSEKLPAVQIYPGDWFRDAGAQSLDYRMRGIWWELVLVMHGCKDRGKLVFDNGAAMPDEAIARRLGIGLAEWMDARGKLLDYGVASVDGATGALMNRRMVRDEAVRRSRVLAGEESGKSRNDRIQKNRYGRYQNGRVEEVSKQCGNFTVSIGAEEFTQSMFPWDAPENEQNGNKTRTKSGSSSSSSTSKEEEGGAAPQPPPSLVASPEAERVEESLSACMEAAKPFLTPSKRTKERSFKDLFRQGVEADRIVSALASNSTSSFYAVVDALANRKASVSRRTPVRPTARDLQAEEAAKISHEASEVAKVEADRRISETPENEIAAWRREIEADAKSRGWTPFLTESTMRCALRLRAAKKFGIAGL